MRSSPPVNAPDIAGTSRASTSPSRDLGGRISLARALAWSVPALLVPGAIVLDTAVAVLAGWRPRAAFARAVPIGAGLLGLGFLLLVVLPRVRPFHRWIAPRLAAALLALLVAWIAADVYLYLHVPRFHLRAPGLHVVCHPAPGVMPGIVGEAHYTMNSSGFRGPELPEDHAAYRIFCLGGSTTVCFYLDDSECWPQLVMDSLNARQGERPAWVGSTGISGYRMDEHLRLVRRSPLVARMDCLVLLVGINDLLSELNTTRAVVPLWARSKVLRRLTSREQGVGPPDLRVEDAAGSMYGPRRAYRQKRLIVDRAPDLGRGQREYAAKVEALVAELRERGVRPIFMTQPVLWRADLPEEQEKLLWLGMLTEDTFLSTARLREAMERYNESLLATCARLGVDCIDLAPLHGRPELFYDDCHYNPAGSHAVADAVTGWLMERWPELAGPPQ